LIKSSISSPLPTETPRRYSRAGGSGVQVYGSLTTARCLVDLGLFGFCSFTLVSSPLFFLNPRQNRVFKFISTFLSLLNWQTCQVAWGPPPPPLCLSTLQLSPHTAVSWLGKFMRNRFFILAASDRFSDSTLCLFFYFPHSIEK